MTVVTYLGSLVQLCCGGRGTLKISTASMCRECSQRMDHTGFDRPRQHVLPRSILPRLQGALQDPDGLCILCPSQAQVIRVTGCLASALSQVGRVSYTPPRSWPLGFSGAPLRHSIRHTVCLLWGADLRLWHSWNLWTVQDPRKMCLATGSPLRVCWKMWSLAEIAAAPCLAALAVANLPLCLQGGKALNGSWLVLLFFFFVIL